MTSVKSKIKSFVQIFDKGQKKYIFLIKKKIWTSYNYPSGISTIFFDVIKI